MARYTASPMSAHLLNCVLMSTIACAILSLFPQQQAEDPCQQLTAVSRTVSTTVSTRAPDSCFSPLFMVFLWSFLKERGQGVIPCPRLYFLNCIQIESFSGIVIQRVGPLSVDRNSEVEMIAGRGEPVVPPYPMT